MTISSFSLAAIKYEFAEQIPNIFYEKIREKSKRESPPFASATRRAIDGNDGAITARAASVDARPGRGLPEDTPVVGR